MAVANKLICCTCLSLVIVGAILMLFFYAILNPKCELIKEKPATDLTKMKLLEEDSEFALAKVAGHLKYKTDNETENIYLPLDFNGIYVKVKQQENKRLYGVSLRSRCAKVMLMYPYSDTTTTVDKIFVTLERPNGQHKTCNINNPKGLTFAKGYHYKCAETKQYLCYEDDKAKDPKAPPALVATLALDYLEFEVGGDKKNFDEGKFSTPATESCGY